MCCPVDSDGTGGRLPAAGGRLSLPGRASELARAEKSIERLYSSDHDPQLSQPFALRHDPQFSQPFALRLSTVTVPHLLGHLRATQPIIASSMRFSESGGALPVAPVHPACCSHLFAPCAASMLGSMINLRYQNR